VRERRPRWPQCKNESAPDWDDLYALTVMHVLADMHSSPPEYLQIPSVITAVHILQLISRSYA
jgi:hypothetical protein